MNPPRGIDPGPVTDWILQRRPDLQAPLDFALITGGASGLGAGAARVLFGSDIPLMDPRPQLGKILTADIGHDDKRQILGNNARRLLHL